MGGGSFLKSSLPSKKRGGCGGGSGGGNGNSSSSRPGSGGRTGGGSSARGRHHHHHHSHSRSRSREAGSRSEGAAAAGGDNSANGNGGERERNSPSVSQDDDDDDTCNNIPPARQPPKDKDNTGGDAPPQEDKAEAGKQDDDVGVEEEDGDGDDSPPSSGESTELPDCMRPGHGERQASGGGSSRKRQRDDDDDGQRQQRRQHGENNNNNNDDDQVRGQQQDQQAQQEAQQLPRESPNMVVTQLGTDGEDNDGEDDDGDGENALLLEDGNNDNNNHENNDNATNTSGAAAAAAAAGGGGGGGDVMMTLPTQTYPMPQKNDDFNGGDGDDAGGTNTQEDDEETRDGYGAPSTATTTTATTLHQRQAIADEVSRLIERQVQSETRRLRAELSDAQSTVSTLRTDLQTLRTTSRQTVEAMESTHRTQLATVQSELDAALAEAAQAAAAEQRRPKCDCGDTILPRLEGQVSALQSDLRTTQRKLSEMNDKYQRTKRMAKERDGQLRSIARMVQEQQQQRGDDQDSPPVFSPSQSQRVGELLGGLGSLGSNEDSDTDDDNDDGKSAGTGGAGGGAAKNASSKAARDKKVDAKTNDGVEPVAQQQQQQQQPQPRRKERRHSFVKQLFPAEDVTMTNEKGGDEKISGTNANTVDDVPADKKSGGDTVGRDLSREKEDKAMKDDASDHQEMDETPMTEPILLRSSPSPQPAKRVPAKRGQGMHKNQDEPEMGANSASEVETSAAPAPTVRTLPKNPYAKSSSTSNGAAATKPKSAVGATDRGRTKSTDRSTGGSGEKRRRPYDGDSAHSGSSAAGSGKARNSLRSLVASAVAASIPRGLTGRQAGQPQAKKRKGRDGSAGAAGQGMEKENRENRVTSRKAIGSRSDIPIPTFSSSPPRPSSSSAHKGADTKGRGIKRNVNNTIVIDSDEDSSEDESERGEEVTKKQAKNHMAPPPPRRRTMSPPVPVRTVQVPSRGSKTTDGKNATAQARGYESASEEASIPYTRIPRNRKGKGGKAAADSSDEPGFKYQEVVRDRDKRRAMKGYECEQCRDFYEALEKGGSGKDFNRREMVCEHSRHRSNHAPDLTPKDFWELSFADSQKSPSQCLPCARRDEDV